MGSRRELNLDLEMLTPAQLSASLQISERTLARWRQENVGPEFRRVGRRVLYRPRDVAMWLDKQPAA